MPWKVLQLVPLSDLNAGLSLTLNNPECTEPISSLSD